jgi:hypothetical protein
LDPLAASRPQVELYVRWMQEVRRLKPSTTSRRTSIVAGFYRTAVIDGLLEQSPAEHVRRPHVPPDSPTLGLTHLQLEALLAAARDSANRFDFALVCLLGLLGLRIFEATGLDITDLGEEHGHRVLRVLGKGSKTVLVPLRRPSAEPSTTQSVIEQSAQCCSTPAAHAWTGTPPPAASARSLRRPVCGCRPSIRTCFATPTSPPCSTPASTSATSRSPPATPTRGPPCATTEPATSFDRHPNYILDPVVARPCR